MILFETTGHVLIGLPSMQVDSGLGAPQLRVSSRWTPEAAQQ